MGAAFLPYLLAPGHDVIKIMWLICCKGEFFSGAEGGQLSDYCLQKKGAINLPPQICAGTKICAVLCP